LRKADDYSLPDVQLGLIRKHAERALASAGAIGRFPTPVADVIEAAKVIVAEEDVLDLPFLAKLRKQAGGALRSALTKVLGVLDATARIIYVDRTIHAVKQTFLKLHETAHAVLPWQRDIFVVAEDCEQTLAPEIAESFEREANAFASEVLFQLDAFSKEAEDHKVGILVPVRLSKRYGASIYASVRRYVSQNARACLVLVLEPPSICPRRGYVAKFRREVVSPEFRRVMGSLSWPDEFGPEDNIGAMIPVGGRKMSRPRQITLRDRNGRTHECIAEAFTQSHQIFVLIHSITLRSGPMISVHQTIRSAANLLQ
jgi:Zn-dependent peptidase ImmA (M78 family)